MQYLSDRILQFYQDVDLDCVLPPDIQLLNPYRDSSNIRALCKSFYHKFYNDNESRVLILGINPGRLGAGATGIPFTDTKRLTQYCEIPFEGFSTHEPSSAFIYEMIDAFGGAKAFYERFYINSICPLGFTKRMSNGREINYNYYDDKALTKAVEDFIIENLHKQVALAGRDDLCYCLGTGKNFQYLAKLNQRIKLFGNIYPLEHPRYIMQYKTKSKDVYINHYLSELQKAT